MTSTIAATEKRIIIRDVAMLEDWHNNLPCPLRVALLYGGVSREDRHYIATSPVEQMSVTALREALNGLRIPFDILDPCNPSFVADVLGYDIALSNLHGPFGEDGRLQGLLDWLRKPLCGSGVVASAIAGDKVVCKRFMTGLGIPTPPWQVWQHGRLPQWHGRPLMIKPAMGGSSLGMSLVREDSELIPAIERAWAADPSSVLVEEYVPGTSVTVGLLELPSGVLVFPPLTIQTSGTTFYDAAAKLDGTVTVQPSEFSRPVTDALVFHARRLWTELGCHGAARVDFIVTESGRPYALEVNSTPGLSTDSNFVVGARQVDVMLPDIVRALLHEAISRPTYDVPLPTPALRTRATAPSSAE